MNRVFLKGNVGQDPKITKFQEGGMVATFTLATTERGYKTKDGKEVESQTTWHNISVRKTGLAKIVDQFIKKGSSILIIGKYITREYTSTTGEQKRVYEVQVDDLELCGAAPKKEETPADSYDDLPEDFNL